MVYDGQGSFVSAVKLVHTKGYVSNHHASSGFLGGETDSMQLGILITDTDNRIIYPSPRITEVSITGDKGWYKMPGYTKKSRNLVLSDFAAPQYFEKGTKFRAWYGEDLYDYTETPNLITVAQRTWKCISICLEISLQFANVVCGQLVKQQMIILSSNDYLIV